VTLTNILARQIEHQRYLLAKEARREERRRRRERSKCRLDEGAISFNQHVSPPEVVVQRVNYTHLPTAAPPIDQHPAVIVNVQTPPGTQAHARNVIAEHLTSVNNSICSRKGTI